MSFMIGLASDLFYKRKHVGEALPQKGALLVVSNHPNAGIDPIVVVKTAAPRVIRLLAKEPLFRTPFLSFIVKSMRALPVYRKLDGADTNQNNRTFEAVYDALKNQDAIGLFPEGTSHSDPAMRELKTGAARMALGACAQSDFKNDVAIFPLGLTYDDRPQFRSAVTTWGGRSISTRDYAALYREDEKEAVRALTDEIFVRLKETTINLEQTRDVTLLSLAQKVWSSSNEGEGESALEAKHRIAARALSLEEKYPERLLTLREKLTTFEVQLDELKLDVAHLELPRFFPSVLFVLRNIAGWILGMPCALLGTLAYVIPFMGARQLPIWLKSEEDTVATVRVLYSMVIFPIWQLLLSALAVWFLGPWWGLALALALPLCGLYAYRFFGRRQTALRRAGLVFGFRKGALLRLRALKGEIEQEIAALAEL